ncbi:nucleotide-binding alpha-beta plait domain-containing protein [Tanacetum coccineum]|uniref:Nucleotide-binding alpha-beta plait domain-containing protein n=1 Tax=Tanacetum coccineum TaxID=301880 RepID=A0ABQ5DE66_9ASTR
MENQFDVNNHLVEIQADDHDLLVNFDNKNDDMLGYEFEKYYDDEDADGTNHAEDADGTNHSDLKLVKRGITKLYKFHREYGKPGGIKIKVPVRFNKYQDSILEKSGRKNQEINSGIKSRDILMLPLTIARNLVMHRLGKLLRNFRMKLREKYILPNLNTPSKLNELPAKYSAIVKAEEWVEFVNYTTTDAYKEKSARGKMARSKNVYHHKMGRGGYVFVKEKMIENKEIEADEEPPRGIMWLKGRVNKDGEFTDDEIRSVGDKLKEADDKIKEGTLNLDDGTDAMTVVFGKEKGGRQATDERIKLLQTQLDNERREHQQKDELVKKLSTEMTQKDVLSSVVVRDKDARFKKKSNGLVTSEKEPVKTVGPKKTPKSRRNGSQDSQSQGNVSPTQELPTDGVGGFFAWPKNQVVLDEEVTPPTTIQKISDYNSAPKLQSKRKSYVSRETMQRQARTGKSHKSLNYGS